MQSLWHQLAVAFCLMLVIEGIMPFLYPRRWREMVSKLAEIDDRTMRIIGFSSMLLGTIILYIIN